MKNKLKEIKPGMGLGILKFGMSREEVQALLGKPDEKEMHSEEGEDISEAWHYDDLDISLGFEDMNYWELETISVSSPDYQFEGHSLVGLKKEKLVALLETWEAEDLEFEDISTQDDVKHEILAADEIGIDFWLEDDVVSEVQWGPFYTDDDTVEWPE